MTKLTAIEKRKMLSALKETVVVDPSLWDKTSIGIAKNAILKGEIVPEDEAIMKIGTAIDRETHAVAQRIILKGHDGNIPLYVQILKSKMFSKTNFSMSAFRV